MAFIGEITIRVEFPEDVDNIKVTKDEARAYLRKWHDYLQGEIDKGDSARIDILVGPVYDEEDMRKELEKPTRAEEILDEMNNALDEAEKRLSDE